MSPGKEGQRGGDGSPETRETDGLQAGKRPHRDGPGPGRSPGYVS